METRCKYRRQNEDHPPTFTVQLDRVEMPTSSSSMCTASAGHVA